MRTGVRSARAQRRSAKSRYRGNRALGGEGLLETGTEHPSSPPPPLIAVNRACASFHVVRKLIACRARRIWSGLAATRVKLTNDLFKVMRQIARQRDRNPAARLIGQRRVRRTTPPKNQAPFGHFHDPEMLDRFLDLPASIFASILNAPEKAQPPPAQQLPVRDS